ncbi:hypothetical protein Poli38472_009603 [Pythium oligandrum]|uniref:Autophagy-related protein 2 n=1 Tax=Pythium oligandrum TaxID=41045 RepID=A0A8K1CF78_PYTOL|nr:hypothetical protein Poli38472_009603 [Pythium oligandrum]|eukprot:TMW62110.1 hypothetical protein Poli38472_009603 [Pythium oligandrum]
MQFFKQLTDPALKRLYKFVLKRLIGRFLAEDEIDLDQLDVHLRSGRLELCDLLLNAEVLNREVCEANGLPFRVKKGYLGSVRVTISYTNILSESCLVEIDDIEVILVPVSADGDNDNDKNWKEEGTSVGGLNAATKASLDGINESKQAEEDTQDHMDEVSQEGLDFVASWIEQVTSKIKVTLSNICLRLETGQSEESDKNVAMLFKLDWAQFTDESASEVASVYGRAGNIDQSFGGAQSMYQSMAASSLFGISQKGIKFRGISMDLSVPGEESEGADDPVIYPFLASDSTRQCYVQLKVSHYEALEAPSIDADLFLHSIRVVLQPQHFPQFGTLMDAFGEEPGAHSRSRTDDPYHVTSMYQSVCDAQPKWLHEEETEQATDADGALKLSFREFQRIEQLLKHYHQTHQDLRSMAQRAASGSNADDDVPFPMPRRLSMADSVESVGLSDLDEEDNFFECETGAESVSGNVHFGASSVMAQSMYASALYDAEDIQQNTTGQAATSSLRSSVKGKSASRSVRNRVKLHLLECDIILLYDDMLDYDEEEETYDGYSPRQRKLHERSRRHLPTITDQERLEVCIKDIIFSTLVYPSHISMSFSVGTLEIVEKTLARLSTEIVEDEHSMITTSILKFVDYSPATGRKVHLSANLSAQIRIDLTNDDEPKTESMAVQISAQPILFEWDMYILDRAHRLMKLLEDSSAAKAKKAALAGPQSPPLPVFPKKLDVNSECIEITLRFPMVASDLIRFGPSSKRGLSEDKFVLTLEGVKVSSYADDPEQIDLSEKEALPWLSDIRIRFDNAVISLIGPKGGNQRAKDLHKTVIITATSDNTSGDACELRLRTQTPTTEQIRAAATAKHSMSQDSLENLDTTSVGMIEEEKSGDDNDGGRIGSNGWSQDARARAHKFEVTAAAAALFDLEITIPQSLIVFNKESFDRLMILFDALMMINPIDINGHNQMMMTPAYRNRLIPSYMTVKVTLVDGTLQLQYSKPGTQKNGAEDSTTMSAPSSIYHLAFQDFKIFQVSQWMGQLVSRVHISGDNLTLLEELCEFNEVYPVLYKNPIGVNEAPIVFIGIDIVDQTQEMREMKVDLHFSQVNWRYQVASKWMLELAELLLLEYPLPIIPLDSPSMDEAEFTAMMTRVDLDTYEPVRLAIPPKTIFTKLFVSLYDAVLDYTPTTLTSRVMLVLGNVGVSSNVVTGAMIQGYKISVRDVQLYLTPDAPSYAEMDERLLGNELFLNPQARKKKKGVGFEKERSRGQLAPLYPSMLMFFEKHGFLQMVTLDFIDVFLRAIVVAEPSGKPGSTDIEHKPSTLGSPELSVELTLGTANIYACFDSFNTLIELVSTWGEQLSEEAEPRDTTAYVGLDRVKDLSSVSVVTNLGPSRKRAVGTLSEDTSSVVASVSVDASTRGRSIRSGLHGRSEQGSASSVVSADTAVPTRNHGIDILAQIDENAFGSGKGIFPGKHVATDTEARLLRTRLDEIHKEKTRIVTGEGLRDDMLSATDLRRKYKDTDQNRPRMRINELVIEDYYDGTRLRSASGQLSDAGAFLMADETAESAPPAVENNPWFASSPPDRPAFPGDQHPIGSLPDEQAARWLPPSGFMQNQNFAGTPSATSSPRFDPVDEDAGSAVSEGAVVDELSSLHDLLLQDRGEDDDSEDDDYPSAAFPAASKNWWGLENRPDVELSELQTDTDSMFSHQLPFPDDDHHAAGDDSQHPLSMSIIGTGDDEGTEVELDFTMDREMQSKFYHLMEDERSDVREEEEEETEDGSEDGKPTMTFAVRSASMSNPIPFRSIHGPGHPRAPSLASPSAATMTSIFSPPDEPTARWFYDEAGPGAGERAGPPSRIIPHHVEIPIGGTAASLSFGEKERDEAIRNIARENAAMKQPSSTPILIRHVLLRDFNICMRFFGGSDWSRDNINAPSLKHRDVPRDDASSSKPMLSVDARGGTGDRKEKLLDALVDNYVPSPAADLFGSEQGESSLFALSKTAPARTFMADRSTSSRSSGAIGTRKRSLKSGRKTEEMLELVVTRIQLRLDMFNDDEHQPLASNTVVALGDIEILDYISTSQIRKIICYWKSDISHPRESGSSMVHLHLMTVRPGPNLCEEHRLKVRILPLRVNLDQEVVNFLRQFIPTDDSATHRQSTVSTGEENESAPPMDGTELSVMNAPSPTRVRETDVSLGNWFFQNIDVRPCKIKIDYRPNRVDYQALRAGDYLEVINLFVLEGMELVLRRVRASGIDGWAALGEHVLMSWVNDISRHQIHKCVASVSMPPLRSFANIGSGAADLILLPMEHYGKDRRIVRGFKKGAKSFLKSVTIETLNTASKMAQGTQALLEHADDVVSSASSRRKQIKYRQPGSRIARNSKRMGGGGIRSAQDRGGIGSRQYLAQQPSNATEGLYQAYDSLSRELHVAAKTIVAVPLVEYKKTGSQGYVRSVIRAVPVAVLRPMIGATEAVSKALIGVRNAVDPELKEDVENKFKDFRTI